VKKLIKRFFKGNSELSAKEVEAVLMQRLSQFEQTFGDFQTLYSQAHKNKEKGYDQLEELLKIKPWPEEIALKSEVIRQEMGIEILLINKASQLVLAMFNQCKADNDVSRRIFKEKYGQDIDQLLVDETREAWKEKFGVACENCKK
jgi:hypothetical protein